MKSMDSVGVTFVNAVVGSGTLNGVVNLQFGTFQFDPSQDDTKISEELTVSLRLRMDVTCAAQLLETLSHLLGTLKQNEMPAETATETAH